MFYFRRNHSDDRLKLNITFIAMFVKKAVKRRNLVTLCVIIIAGYFVVPFVYQGRDTGDAKQKM
jgi:hypothetical protein